MTFRHPYTVLYAIFCPSWLLNYSTPFQKDPVRQDTYCGSINCIPTKFAWPVILLESSRYFHTFAHLSPLSLRFTHGYSYKLLLFKVYLITCSAPTKHMSYYTTQLRYLCISDLSCTQYIFCVLGGAGQPFQQQTSWYRYPLPHSVGLYTSTLASLLL